MTVVIYKALLVLGFRILDDCRQTQIPRGLVSNGRILVRTGGSPIHLFQVYHGVVMHCHCALNLIHLWPEDSLMLILSDPAE